MLKTLTNGLDESCRGYKLVYLPANGRHYGLGLGVADSLFDNILRYWSVSDRIAVIQVRISSLHDHQCIRPHCGLTVYDVEVQYVFLLT